MSRALVILAVGWVVWFITAMYVSYARQLPRLAETNAKACVVAPTLRTPFRPRNVRTLEKDSPIA